MIGESQEPPKEPKQVLLREKSYTVWWCPHCDQEIFEKHSYAADPENFMTSHVMIHSDCGGAFIPPKAKRNEIPDWLMPHMPPDSVE